MMAYERVRAQGEGVKKTRTTLWEMCIQEAVDKLEDKTGQKQHCRNRIMSRVEFTKEGYMQ